MSKISIRFFADREVRAVWDEDHGKWWFSVLDVVGVLNQQDDYEKNRNYWKYLKAKLKKTGNQLGSSATQLKLTARDGKKYQADVLDFNGIVELGRQFPGKKANRFMEWFTYSDETLDGKSKQKAYALFETSFINSMAVGTEQGLRQIHAYLFGGLYDFAGQIRTVNLSKGNFTFAPAMFLQKALQTITAMPETTLAEIVDKYVEMNIAHPFREGNGRATRIWLDLMLKKNLNVCVDWSRIGKQDYLAAMQKSVTDSTDIKKLLENALTHKINDRAMFMKGIDYSYYYEEDNTAEEPT